MMFEYLHSLQNCLSMVWCISKGNLCPPKCLGQPTFFDCNVLSEKPEWYAENSVTVEEHCIALSTVSDPSST